MAHDFEHDLYVHQNRPGWGLAIPTQTRANKVDFLFQDGTERTFRDDFLHLLQPADRPRDVTQRVVKRLRKKANGAVLAPKVAQVDDVPTLTEQIRVFHHLYPGGFEDPAFIAKFRGTPDTRRRKSHHARGAEAFQTELAKDKLRAMLDSKGEQATVEHFCDLMQATSLAPRKALNRLREKGGAAHLGSALYDMLHDESVCMFDRFTRWVIALEMALGRGPTWAMATAAPALMDPESHVAVRRAPFQREAAWMAPSLRLTKVPNADIYRRLRGMAESLRKALTEAGLEPRDLLDVATFVRVLMRPKHMALVEELPPVN